MKRIILAVLCWSSPAWAARHEISLEFSNTGHTDDKIRQLVGRRALPAIGLRGGGAVLRDVGRFGLVIDGGWVRSVRSGSFGLEDATGSEIRYAGAALVTDLFTVGAKADLDVGNIFYPYLHAQAGLSSAAIKLDDDIRSDRNVNQLKEGAIAGAGLFSVGFELMLPDERLGWPVTAAWYLEGGYHLQSAHRFTDLAGSINLSGAMFRTGLGLRF